jgi:hypothetical protein
VGSEIMTALGPVPAGRIGITLMREHLFINLVGSPAILFIGSIA